MNLPIHSNNFAFVLLSCVVWLALPVHARPANSQRLWQATANATGFDVNALYQMALKRTGVAWADGITRPWPWTVHIRHCRQHKPGLYRLRSSADAVAMIRNAPSCDMDIGLMQVNARAFRGVFKTDPAELVEPQINLMAASILMKRSTPARHRPTASDASLAALVTRTAGLYRIDPALVMAVIRQESGFNVRARSNKNARGLMQLMPATARRFGVKDAYDPMQNVRGGVAYLNFLLRRFNGNVALALAGYNAGEGAVDAYGTIPPYGETQAYVASIMASYRKSYHPVPPEIS